jgi:hypothetical protein
MDTARSRPPGPDAPEPLQCEYPGELLEPGHPDPDHGAEPQRKKERALHQRGDQVAHVVPLGLRQPPEDGQHLHDGEHEERQGEEDPLQDVPLPGSRSGIQCGQGLAAQVTLKREDEEDGPAAEDERVDHHLPHAP